MFIKISQVQLRPLLAKKAGLAVISQPAQYKYTQNQTGINVWLYLRLLVGKTFKKKKVAKHELLRCPCSFQYSVSLPRLALTKRAYHGIWLTTRPTIYYLCSPSFSNHVLSWLKLLILPHNFVLMLMLIQHLQPPQNKARLNPPKTQHPHTASLPACIPFIYLLLLFFLITCYLD